MSIMRGGGGGGGTFVEMEGATLAYENFIDLPVVVFGSFLFLFFVFNE